MPGRCYATVVSGGGQSLSDGNRDGVLDAADARPETPLSVLVDPDSQLTVLFKQEEQAVRGRDLHWLR